jgi:hypothetical protein
MVAVTDAAAMDTQGVATLAAFVADTLAEPVDMPAAVFAVA